MILVILFLVTWTITPLICNVGDGLDEYYGMRILFMLCIIAFVVSLMLK